ncbi:hypothetical protein, partial [Plasmodium yoelii yoelii]
VLSRYTIYFFFINFFFINYVNFN